MKSRHIHLQTPRGPRKVRITRAYRLAHAELYSKPKPRKVANPRVPA